MWYSRERFLVNIKWATFYLYNGENKLHFYGGNVMNHHVELYLYNARTSVTAIGHIILILNQAVFNITP